MTHGSKAQSSSLFRHLHTRLEHLPALRLGLNTDSQRAQLSAGVKFVPRGVDIMQSMHDISARHACG